MYQTNEQNSSNRPIEMEISDLLDRKFNKCHIDAHHGQENSA